MIIYYFGADLSWEELKEKGFHRRNTYILKALGEDSRVTKVYNIRRTTASKFIEKFLNRLKGQNIADVWYAPLIPSWLLFINKLNPYIFRIMIFFQTKSFKEKEFTWCYWPQAYLQAKELGYLKNLIFDVDHNIIDDPNLERDKKEFLLKILNEISYTAKFVLSASRTMNDWFRQSGFSKPILFRNGIEPERFVIKKPKKNIIKNLGIGYVGALSRWIDLDLLNKIIESRPQYTFTIIGSDFKTSISEEIRNKANVNWLGTKSAYEIPALMHKMKVGLCLYKRIPGMDGDSMKIYEYLAAGLPVVTTGYHEHLEEDFNGILNIADSLENILKYLDDFYTGKTKIKGEEINEFLNQSQWNLRVSNFITKNLINVN